MSTITTLLSVYNLNDDYLINAVNHVFLSQGRIIQGYQYLLAFHFLNLNIGKRHDTHTS